MDLKSRKMTIHSLDKNSKEFKYRDSFSSGMLFLIRFLHSRLDLIAYCRGYFNLLR